MTVDEIRRALGLMEFEDFKQWHRANNDENTKRVYGERWKEYRDRRTGRTTKLICEALAAASTGTPICVIGWNHASTQMLDQQLELTARELGIKIPRSDYNDQVVFRDTL